MEELPLFFTGIFAHGHDDVPSAIRRGLDGERPRLDQRGAQRHLQGHHRRDRVQRRRYFAGHSPDHPGVPFHVFHEVGQPEYRAGAGILSRHGQYHVVPPGPWSENSSSEPVVRLRLRRDAPSSYGCVYCGQPADQCGRRATIPC